MLFVTSLARPAPGTSTETVTLPGGDSVASHSTCMASLACAVYVVV